MDPIHDLDRFLKSHNLDMLQSNGNLIQLHIGFRHVEHKPGVKPSGPNGFDLLQAGRRCQLQLGVRLALPEAPE